MGENFMLSNQKNKGLSSFFSLLLLLLFVFFGMRIQLLADGVRLAMKLCAYALIPTLFPFLVLTDLILSLDAAERFLHFFSRPLLRPLRLSKYGGIAYLMGALFGFPMGAKAIAHYYRLGSLSKEESERLLLFSGNASPFFLIGGVGLGMLSSLYTGIYLYALQLFISLACGFLLGRFAPPSKENKNENLSEKEAFSFPKSVRGGVLQSLFISGYVMFFSATCHALIPLLKNKFLSGMAASLLEISTACSISTANRDVFSLPLCAFSIAFSGFSVFFQTADCITQTDLKLKRYLPVKILCGCAAFFLTLLLVRFG